jgi:hypothetical protein
MKSITKSAKLANVCYDIRGPIMDAARRMEEEGHKIIKLNIGNLAPFGFDSPDEIQQDMIRNLPNSAGYSDSKGIFAARKAVMHETQRQGIKGVGLDDIYLGNGASELIVMATNGLLNDGDELLLPAPDYPLWTAAASLSGGTPVLLAGTSLERRGGRLILRLIEGSGVFAGESVLRLGLFDAQLGERQRIDLDVADIEADRRTAVRPGPGPGP